MQILSRGRPLIHRWNLRGSVASRTASTQASRSWSAATALTMGSFNATHTDRHAGAARRHRRTQQPGGAKSARYRRTRGGAQVRSAQPKRWRGQPALFASQPTRPHRSPRPTPRPPAVPAITRTAPTLQCHQPIHPVQIGDERASERSGGYPRMHRGGTARSAWRRRVIAPTPSSCPI